MSSFMLFHPRDFASRDERLSSLRRDNLVVGAYDMEHWCLLNTPRHQGVDFSRSTGTKACNRYAEL